MGESVLAVAMVENMEADVQQIQRLCLQDTPKACLSGCVSFHGVNSVQICMTAGDGESSYAANSGRQATAFRQLEPSLRGLLALGAPDWFRDVILVADLGCATGANAVAEVETIIDSLTQLSYPASSASSPKFHVFFDDLPSNDFNGLLRLVQHKDYSASAVAGSFYRPLFPRRTLHVCFSMMALHWLSTVPPAVLDPESPAYNGGRVWIDGGHEAAAAAYAAQADEDLRQFLSCRAAEMRPGGVLWLCMMGRPDECPPVCQVAGGEGAYCGADFDATWDDVAAAGGAAAERARRRFQLPWYFRSAEEARAGVDESEWRVVQCEAVQRVRCMEQAAFDAWVCADDFGRRKAALVRSFVGSLVHAALAPVDPALPDAFFGQLALRSSQFLRLQLIRPSPFVTVTILALQKH